MSNNQHGQTPGVAVSDDAGYVSKSEMPTGVFNKILPNAANHRVILGAELGLLDSINRRHPDSFAHYKNLIDLQWAEDEFPHQKSMVELEAASQEDRDIVIDTLAWQWETDSVIARILGVVINSFVTDSDILLGYGRIIDNENLHALSYSEIARTAFADPHEMLNRVLANEEAHSRLIEPALIFEEARVAALKYGLGMLTATEVLPTALLFFATLPTLERAQFMPSFAVTFAFGEQGRFRSIANTVQKICQDEFEVHVPFNKGVFLKIISTPEGRNAFDKIYPRIIKLLNAVNASEAQWVDHLFRGRRGIVGLTRDGLLAYNNHSASDMALFFGIEDRVNFPIVRDNPLPYMDEWVNISLTQKSPQEEDPNQYKLNIVERNDADVIYPINFL